MDKINDGGPAFPTTQGMGSLARKHIGLSMRDYFAAKAMPEMAWADDGGNDSRAIRCYEIADAMLRAREAT